MEGEEGGGTEAVVLNGEGGSFPVPSRPTLSFALSCKVQVRPAFVCVCFSPLVYIYCNYRVFIIYHER